MLRHSNNHNPIPRPLTVDDLIAQKVVHPDDRNSVHVKNLLAKHNQAPIHLSVSMKNGGMSSVTMGRLNRKQEEQFFKDREEMH